MDDEDPGCWDDMDDPSTYNPTLDDESRGTTECQDGDDNDGDYLIDENDNGCWAIIGDPSSYDPTDHDEELREEICDDGLDNDGDGLIDSLIELNPDNNEQNTFEGDPHEIKDLIDPKTDFNFYCPLGGANTGPILRSQTNGWSESITPDKLHQTAHKACNLLGYREAVDAGCTASNGMCNYHSPEDNCVFYWDGSQWLYTNAGGWWKGQNSWITDLQCEGRLAACSDGVDNDGNGLIDMADPGCDNPDDGSEIPHDPDCPAPATPECSDGIDNDNDGLIDYSDCNHVLDEFNFNACHEIRTYVNSLGMGDHVPDQAHNQGCLRPDQTTADKICELKGYDTATITNTGSWHSCGDNHVTWWDGSRFVTHNACVDNRNLAGF